MHFRIAILFYLFLFNYSLTASGTFIYPPDPPKKTVMVKESTFQMGKRLFERVFRTGNSCSTCHSKSADQKFRRRSLHRTINKFLPWLNKCVLDGKRIGGDQAYSGESLEYQSLRLYLAREYRLLEYLK